MTTETHTHTYPGPGILFREFPASKYTKPLLCQGQNTPTETPARSQHPAHLCCLLLPEYLGQELPPLTAPRCSWGEENKHSRLLR